MHEVTLKSKLTRDYVFIVLKIVQVLLKSNVLLFVENKMTLYRFRGNLKS